MASYSQGDSLHDGKEWHLRVKGIISIPYKGLSLSLVEPISMTLGAYLFEGKILPLLYIALTCMLSGKYDIRSKLACMGLILMFMIYMRVMSGLL